LAWIHLPSKWDGGPHTPILPGATWNPSFTVMDNAATYWYHPHFHMKTAKQAIKGAAGLIIVRDPIEAAIIIA
jgi:blue copper oxidase